MKRLICPLVVLFALVLALPAAAQQRYAGVIGGLNIAKIDVVNSSGVDQLIHRPNYLRDWRCLGFPP